MSATQLDSMVSSACAVATSANIESEPNSNATSSAALSAALLHRQHQQHPQLHLDPNNANRANSILSRMVTASTMTQTNRGMQGIKGMQGMQGMHVPIRVATMSDFRRSLNSLNSLNNNNGQNGQKVTQHEMLKQHQLQGRFGSIGSGSGNRKGQGSQGSQGGRQLGQLNDGSRRSSTSSIAQLLQQHSNLQQLQQLHQQQVYPLPGASANPLLKLMEERMAAQAGQTGQAGQAAAKQPQRQDSGATESASVSDASRTSARSIECDEHGDGGDGASSRLSQTSQTSSDGEAKEAKDAKEANAALQASINKWAGLSQRAATRSQQSQHSPTDAQPTQPTPAPTPTPSSQASEFSLTQLLELRSGIDKMETVCEKNILKTPLRTSTSMKCFSSPRRVTLPAMETSSLNSSSSSSSRSTSLSQGPKQSNQSKQDLLQTQQDILKKAFGQHGIDLNQVQQSHQSHAPKSLLMDTRDAPPPICRGTKEKYSSMPNLNQLAQLQRIQQQHLQQQLALQCSGKTSGSIRSNDQFVLQHYLQSHHQQQIGNGNSPSTSVQPNLNLVRRVSQTTQQSSSPTNGLSNGLSNSFRRKGSKGTAGSAGMKHSDSQSSFRKRSSLVLDGEDDDLDDDMTKCTTNSSTPSTASIASSNKIHRSLSHSSARSCLMGSMENLRIKSPHPSIATQGVGGLNSMMRRSADTSDYRKNQSFSNALSASSASGLGSLNVSTLGSSLKMTSNEAWANNLLNVLIRTSAPSEKVISPPQGQAPSSKPEQFSSAPQPQKQPSSEAATASPVIPASNITTANTHHQKVICSSVPDRIKFQNVKPETKPIDVVVQALSSRGKPCEIKPCLSMCDEFFFQYTEENLNSYCQEAVDAIRSNDLDSLKKLHAEGVNFQTANRFGESLIHLACRRSHKDVVSFLINEGGVSLRVKDDYGRTPMHDACWRSEPDLDLLNLLLDREPQLLMLSDRRGHTPLDYSRREHWSVLVPFLVERADKFESV